MSKLEEKARQMESTGNLKKAFDQWRKASKQHIIENNFSKAISNLEEAARVAENLDNKEMIFESLREAYNIACDTKNEPEKKRISKTIIPIGTEVLTINRSEKTKSEKIIDLLQFLIECANTADEISDVVNEFRVEKARLLRDLANSLIQGLGRFGRAQKIERAMEQFRESRVLFLEASDFKEAIRTDFDAVRQLHFIGEEENVKSFLDSAANIAIRNDESRARNTYWSNIESLAASEEEKLISQPKYDSEVFNPIKNPAVSFVKLGTSLARDIRKEKDVPELTTHLDNLAQHSYDMNDLENSLKLWEIQIDSLVKTENYGEAIGVSEKLLKLGLELFSQKNFESAKNFVLSAASVGEVAGNPLHSARIRVQLGTILLNQGSYSDSFDLYSQSLSIYVEQALNESEEVIQKVGNAFLATYDTAVEEYRIKIAKLLAEVAKNSGIAHLQGLTPEKGEIFLNWCQNIAKNVNPSFSEIETLFWEAAAEIGRKENQNKSANVHLEWSKRLWETERTEEALKRLNVGYETISRDKELIFKFSSQAVDWAENQLLLDNKIMAKELFNLAIRIFEENEGVEEATNTSSHAATRFLEVAEWEFADEFHERTLNLFSSSENQYEGAVFSLKFGLTMMDLGERQRAFTTILNTAFDLISELNAKELLREGLKLLTIRGEALTGKNHPDSNMVWLETLAKCPDESELKVDIQIAKIMALRESKKYEEFILENNEILESILRDKSPLIEKATNLVWAFLISARDVVLEGNEELATRILETSHQQTIKLGSLMLKHRSQEQLKLFWTKLKDFAGDIEERGYDELAKGAWEIPIKIAGHMTELEVGDTYLSRAQQLIALNRHKEGKKALLKSRDALFGSDHKVMLEKLGRTLIDLAEFYEENDNFNEAFDSLSNAIPILIDAGFREEAAEALDAASTNFLRNNEFELSERLMEMAIHEWEEIGLEERIAKLLHRNGVFEHRFGEYIRSLDHLTRAANIFYELEPLEETAQRILLDLKKLGDELEVHGHLEPSREFITRTIKIGEKINPIFAGDVVRERAKKYLELGEGEKVVDDYHKARSMYASSKEHLDSLGLEIVAKSLDCVESIHIEIIPHLVEIALDAAGEIVLDDISKIETKCWKTDNFKVGTQLVELTSNFLKIKGRNLDAGERWLISARYLRDLAKYREALPKYKTAGEIFVAESADYGKIIAEECSALAIELVRLSADPILLEIRELEKLVSECGFADVPENIPIEQILKRGKHLIADNNNKIVTDRDWLFRVSGKIRSKCDELGEIDLNTLEELVCKDEDMETLPRPLLIVLSEKMTEDGNFVLAASKRKLMSREYVKREILRRVE